MSETTMNATQWTEVFRAIGLDDDQMHRWHAELESRYPEGHQSFLEWLGMPAERIANGRRRSAGEWAA